MNITVNSPSYKRASGVDTLKYLPFCKVWACETEADEYRKANEGAEIVACKKGIQGNKCRILNHILDSEFNAGVEVVVILDDDVSHIGYHEKMKKNKIETDQFLPWIEKHSLLAQEFGSRVWGVNLNSDKQSYREYSPFSLLSVILGPFMVHLPHKLRFDERMPTKDDYDMAVQQLNKYRKILRLNKFYYVNKMAGSGSGQTGGQAACRNVKNEFLQNELLKKKWGKKIVRSDNNERSHTTIKKKTFADINPVIKVPIRGI